METGAARGYEEVFHETMEENLSLLDQYKDIYDTVLGIPFYNEKESLVQLLRLIDSNQDIISSYRILVVCCGDSKSEEILNAINEQNFTMANYAFLMKPGAEGRGASIRALLEVANYLETELVILAADLKNEDVHGFNMQWITQLITPIKYEYDMAMANLRRHHLESLTGTFFSSQLIERFYNCHISDPHSGLYAFSHDIVEDLCQEIHFWSDITQSYGIDMWIITRVLKNDKRLCEVNLGAKLTPAFRDKMDFVFWETAEAMFECISRDSRYWLSRKPFVRKIDTYEGLIYDDVPEAIFLSSKDFRAAFQANSNLWQRVNQVLLPDELSNAVQGVLSNDFPFDHILWNTIIEYYLRGYTFEKTIPRSDMLASLTSLFSGRICEILVTAEKMQRQVNDQSLQGLVFMKTAIAALQSEQSTNFMRLEADFASAWREAEQQIQPHITPAHFMEFIPGVPVILPKRIDGIGRSYVYVEEVFNKVQNRFREQFDKVIHERLGIPTNADSKEIIHELKEYYHDLEDTLRVLLRGDLHTEIGIRTVLDSMIELMATLPMYGIDDELLRQALLRYPPVNVMIPLGCSSTSQLLDRINVRDAFALAALIEDSIYVEKTNEWILSSITPEHLVEQPFQVIILGDNTQFASLNLSSSGTYNRLSNRLVLSPLRESKGGDFTYIHFFLNVDYQVAVASNLSRIWRIYAREKKNLGRKIGNSLSRWLDSGQYSVNNIFENRHHRLIAGSIRVMANSLETAGRTKEADTLRIMSESYGLSQQMKDGVFVPLSAWTWALYSSKGGRDAPLPLYAEVEERWFNQEILQELYVALGFERRAIYHQMVQAIGDGRGSEDLLDLALGITTDSVTAVPQHMSGVPPATPLTRLPNNPILEPITDNYWESRYVLNAASFRLGEIVYILYRAFGDDEVSRIGLAITDGYKVIERLSEPIFVPETEAEIKGCEDPRVVLLDDQIYMLYTAYDGTTAQIAGASISISDFQDRRFDHWQRRGLAFPKVWNKDAVMLPERVNGHYVLYHRIEPSVWLTYLDTLDFPAPRERHAVILGPRSGRMWDSVKIGAGTQPIKTIYGWLMIYHGVDQNKVYRLGVILIDLLHPERLLYRSPNPVLEPQTEYELGVTGRSWVPNVVFTCGAVPAQDKSILDADDEIIVYYGAADSYLCGATGKIGDLIPEIIREQVHHKF